MVIRLKDGPRSPEQYDQYVSARLPPGPPRGDETGECEVETAEFPARFAEVGALRDAFLESTKQKIAEEQGWELASLELEIRAI